MPVMKRSTVRIRPPHGQPAAAGRSGRPAGGPGEASRSMPRDPALTDESMDHMVRRQLESASMSATTARCRARPSSATSPGACRASAAARPPTDPRHAALSQMVAELPGARHTRARVYGFPAAIRPVRYESLDGAKAGSTPRPRARAPERFAETFVTAVSPGFAACSLENQHYDSHEAYVFALARELKQEYEFIVAQGHVLQSARPTSASNAPATSRTSRCRS